jgi:hypothetical protein
MLQAPEGRRGSDMNASITRLGGQQLARREAEIGGLGRSAVPGKAGPTDGTGMRCSEEERDAEEMCRVVVELV